MIRQVDFSHQSQLGGYKTILLMPQGKNCFSHHLIIFGVKAATSWVWKTFTSGHIYFMDDIGKQDGWRLDHNKIHGTDSWHVER